MSKEPTPSQSPLRAEPERVHHPIPRKLESKSHKLIGSKPLDKPRRGRRGHPARQTRADKRKAWLDPHPDEREQLTREQNRIMREEQKARPEGDGPLAGAVAAVARLAAGAWADIKEIDDPEHRAGMAKFIEAQIGAVIGGFDLDQYEAWREECRQRAIREVGDAVPQ